MSALKRKRDPSGTASPVIHPDGQSSTMRASLETSLSELRATTARLESLLSTLPSTSQPRVALGEVLAPAQPLVPSPRASAETAGSTKSCASCSQLQSQLDTLRAQAKDHEREREAWRAFKSWWLASLERRERRRSQKRARPSSSSTGELRAKEGAPGSKRTRGQDGKRNEEERGGEGEGERLRTVLGTLDTETRRVWCEAGIIDSIEGASRELEESEVALPLHAMPSVAAVGKTGGTSNEDVDGTRSNIMAGEAREGEARRDASVVDATASADAIRASRIDAANRSNGTASPRKGHIATLPSTSTTARTPITRPNGTCSSHSASSSTASRPTPTTTRTPSTNSRTRPNAPPLAAHIDDHPIRNPHHRRTLLSSDCPDCSLFYSHLNAATSTGQGDAERAACSRHRSTFARAETPEGYWNIGFPDTQEAERVNEVARRGRGGGGGSGTAGGRDG
ncbi:DNA repair protein Sae2/CtIP [Kalmanozyma brasiliensis GHG001]|uniref:DNA repair protein Sae2/CtIP n=1 Tax=Kalmanozyma brasiliensis (strain GHG001) TaxID=1365824 RepID=UPI002867F924|nr:DNA repair protein Sae2/CtIP [Kalmanozyma brasiliensis GHG001]KAF6767518.1 DNA repair protein Sae2/CtIP [Kalmanozyma brasiliensis GHG001]